MDVVRKTMARYDPRAASLLPMKSGELYRWESYFDGRTALSSLTNRTVQWLEKSGACVDGVRVGSGNPPGGEEGEMGTFAARPVKKGDLVVPVPLMAIDAGAVVGGEVPSLGGCLGHGEMSIALCPLTSSAFIRHQPLEDGEACSSEGECRLSPNAKYVWSDWNLRNADAHKMQPEEVIKVSQCYYGTSYILQCPLIIQR